MQLLYGTEYNLLDIRPIDGADLLYYYNQLYGKHSKWSAAQLYNPLYDMIDTKRLYEHLLMEIPLYYDQMLPRSNLLLNDIENNHAEILEYCAADLLYLHNPDYGKSNSPLLSQLLFLYGRMNNPKIHVRLLV